MNNLYIILQSNGFWSVTANVTTNGIDFVREQGYPAVFYYSRVDLNGSSILDCEKCDNREQLLDALNWCGECGFPILKLWDFDLYHTDKQDVLDCFVSGLQKRYELIQTDLSELLEDTPVSLDEKILQAHNKSHISPKVDDFNGADKGKNYEGERYF